MNQHQIVDTSIHSPSIHPKFIPGDVVRLRDILRRVTAVHRSPWGYVYGCEPLFPGAAQPSKAYGFEPDLKLVKRK